jgi:hypothetical protein
MLQVSAYLASLSDYAHYVKDLLHWPPQATSDAGELIVVGVTLFLSLGIMVVFGQWWSR